VSFVFDSYRMCVPPVHGQLPVFLGLVIALAAPQVQTLQILLVVAKPWPLRSQGAAAVPGRGFLHFLDRTERRRSGLGHDHVSFILSLSYFLFHVRTPFRRKIVQMIASTSVPVRMYNGCGYAGCRISTTQGGACRTSITSYPLCEIHSAPGRRASFTISDRPRDVARTHAGESSEVKSGVGRRR
jgi:hypothetical protein